MNAPAKSLVAKYLGQLAEMTSHDGIYAYRGQANAGWEVESAAYRRLKKGKSEAESKAINQQYFIDYHRQEILEPARMNGYGIKNGQKLSDLELLAELQHNGAATCLIDFTRDFFVALWFACQSYKDEDGGEQDGKVFVLNTNNPETFRSIEQNDMHHKGGVEAVLNFQTREQEKGDEGKVSFEGAPSYWHWSPHGMNQRILRQNSLFVFGKPNVDGELMKKITIPQAEKSDVLRELEMLGTTRESLFRDMPGFANLHGHEESVTLSSPLENFRAGNAAAQEGELNKAVGLYSKAVKNDRCYAEAYHGRAIAQFKLKKYEEALRDLDKAISLGPDKAAWYRNRGIVKHFLEKYDAAIGDLDKAIEIAPNEAILYWVRGYIYTKLDAESARKDLQHAEKLAKQAGDNELISNIEKALSSIGEASDDV
ncbi:MAG: FRG domain-containing protein [Gammaproteobacteria bacterium]|nr:FRG domain-containing protein [Gammaproteobacteria bacterium]